MGRETVKKTKGKTSYVEMASSGKKPARVAGRPKSSYGSHAPSASQIHDAGQIVEIEVPLPHGQETGPLEHETELTDHLVTEVADDSADVNALCETYKLRREELGRLTGFSLRALAEWASGKLPSQPAKRRLQEVRRLLDALAEIVKRESIPRWLHQPNQAFDRLTPLQVIELGEIDRLWAMVHDLRSGQPE
jgi:DNA-binding transcriptional regulator YiaG